MGRGHQRVYARLATRHGAFFLYALFRNPSSIHACGIDGFRYSEFAARPCAVDRSSHPAEFVASCLIHFRPIGRLAPGCAAFGYQNV
jgi:hypothetical protein